MSDIADVPPAVVGRLRVICGELPEAYEEPAWIGLRWRIRRRTFLHVYTTDERRSAYIDLDDPAILMTFRAPPGELAALAHAGPSVLPGRLGCECRGNGAGRRDGLGRGCRAGDGQLSRAGAPPPRVPAEGRWMNRRLPSHVAAYSGSVLRNIPVQVG